jgi:predicted HAD superfamily Cof-like phosphohydrolase
MQTFYDGVERFHKLFQRSAPDAPTLLSAEENELRDRLLVEELLEYREAIAKGDLVEAADALADMVYIIVGTAVSHGLKNFPAMCAEVQRSNMSKLGADGKPIIREDGKILKGPNYSPPNLKQFL